MFEGCSRRFGHGPLEDGVTRYGFSARDVSRFTEFALRAAGQFSQQHVLLIIPRPLALTFFMHKAVIGPDLAKHCMP